MGRTSAQGGSNPLISKTGTNTEDEISKTRQYETRRDQEVWASSHDLSWSTGIQASRSREPVTVGSTEASRDDAMSGLSKSTVVALILLLRAGRCTGALCGFSRSKILTRSSAAMSSLFTHWSWAGE